MLSDFFKGPIECPFCNTKFEVNLSDYSRDKLYSCTNCDKSFSTNESLLISINEGLPRIEEQLHKIETGEIKVSDKDKKAVKDLKKLTESVKAQIENSRK